MTIPDNQFDKEELAAWYETSPPEKDALDLIIGAPILPGSRVRFEILVWLRRWIHLLIKGCSMGRHEKSSKPSAVAF